MIIGALSDTHLSRPDAGLDYILNDLFRDADIILHAGDIVSNAVLERLEERGVLAVCGNMDDFDVAGLIPQTRIVTAGSLRIGLIHGWGSKEGLAERIIQRFAAEKPDLIVYGHSHMPFWGEVNGVRMFNPGAASWNRNSGTGTVGLLEIRDGEIEAKFFPVDR